MFLFIGLAQAALAGYIPLPLDDTYHDCYLNKTVTTKTYLIQPDKKAAIIVVHQGIAFTGKKASATTFESSPTFTDMTPEEVERNGGYKESRFTFNEEDPLYFQLVCNAEQCPLVVNYVHTEPVYRTSAVIGSFGLFICLFLFVFSWTIFCGACRATRKL